jgi:hypothetical protein
MRFLTQFAGILALALLAMSCAPQLKHSARTLSSEDIVGTWHSADRIKGASSEMVISVRADKSCAFENIPVYHHAEDKIKSISGGGHWDMISYIPSSSKTRLTKLTLYPDHLNISIVMDIVEVGENLGLKYSNDPESATVAVFTRK